MRFMVLSFLFALPVAAQAQVAEECADFAGPAPAGYDEGVQQDFLQNYFALSSSFSAIHAPIPHEPGRGMVGVDLNVMPPLGCEKRFVLDHSKTEDTNPTPVIPQLVANVALPALGPLHPYIGLGYVPPVKVFGTTNVILSGEIGLGVPLGDSMQLGARFHATTQKTVGEIASPFQEDDPVFDDLYLASTFGLDLMVGYALGDIESFAITPFGSVGILDASTFFYVGDDGIAANNYHPYLGPAMSLGADALASGRLRFGAEFYAAPGGYSLPDKEVSVVDKGSRYGSLFTGRVRLGVEL
jgi:hypothetical protein